jgi:rSAM/selenodomain-associated transferase 1
MNLDPTSSSPPIGATCALALMAKVPFAGAVKTRLTPPLNQEEAATLSMCFLRDMTTNVASLSGDRTKGIVLYTPADAETLLNGVLPNSVKLFAQRGETLGERLNNAAAELLDKGFQSACLINSDSPTLPGEILTTAASLLAQEGDRVVLGPSQDGGYCLIGLKRPHRYLFERIAWSTADVLAHTIERTVDIDLPVDLLPTWYDVDDAATLRVLCEELCLLPDGHDSRAQFRGGFKAPHTRNYLAGLIAKDSHERFIPGAYRAKTRA